MHRHGYQGKKFGRQTDQRGALLKGLAESLIIYHSIETTLPKAKAVSRYTEKLINKAKHNTLHSRRQVIASLSTLDSAQQLVDVLAPQLNKRSSGYFRIERTELRRGDGSQMAKISFVDDLKAEAPKSPVKPTAKSKTTTQPKKAKVTQPSQKLDNLVDKKVSQPNVASGKPAVRHTRSGER